MALFTPRQQGSFTVDIHAEVPYQGYTQLLVPSSSIVDTPSGLSVLRVENATIHRVAVSQGVRKGGLTEVFGSLEANDIVAVSGSEELREGTKVLVKKREV